MKRKIVLFISTIIFGLFFLIGCNESVEEPITNIEEPIEEPDTDTAEVLAAIVSNVSLEEEIEEDFELVISIGGASIVWASSNEDVIKVENSIAKVTRQEDDVEVVLTATFTLGKFTEVKTYTVTVLAVKSGSTGWLPWV